MTDSTRTLHSVLEEASNKGCLCVQRSIVMIHQASGCKHGRRGRRVRHVRLSSLLRLRVRLFRLVGLVVRCLEELNCCPRRRSSSPATARVQKLSQAGRSGSAARRGSSTSFHADQAIADCLEFIKRSYLQPVQDDHRTAC